LANGTQEVGLLSQVPEVMRHRIVSGMRWTVWLSAISVPFSYATTILLARISPEAIATYGLLMVYIAVVLGLFYFGGDPVAIKFLPELKAEKRSSFLVSYYVVVCLATVPWIVAALLWPSGLTYIFGNQASHPFQLFLIVISPICVLSSLVGAALKGTLEIIWAQIVLRLITIGSFAAYITLYFAGRSFLAANYAPIIWGTYLGLSGIAAGIGLFHLFVHGKNRIVWHKFHFFLPHGFWRYTFSLQQLSALGFFAQRLDMILVLNRGNLPILGQYVAIVTLAETIRVINRFFLDTLLPSITNTIATQDFKAASEIFSTHMRILFIVNTATTCGLILLARPVTSLLGVRYTGLAAPVIVLAVLVGLAAPGGVGGMLLSSVGKQQQAVWITIGQVILYIGLFMLLWRKWELMGAVVAYGASLLLAYFSLLLTAKRTLPFRFSVTRDYAAFALITCIVAGIALRLATFGLTSGLLAWIAAMAVYMYWANYGLWECRQMLQTFFPVVARKIELT
jgi:O-antigen/teichoic acid export membrane protein